MLGVSVNFEWQKEEADFGLCYQCNEIILSNMHTWNVFVGYAIVGKIRMCEDCFNNPERADPEYLITSIQIKRYAAVQTIEISKGGIILGVDTNIKEDVFLYAYVDRNAEQEERTIYTSLTGRQLPKLISRFIGSVKLWEGKGIIHVYE